MLYRENCWEYMQCGRESGGDNAHLLGICPASIAKKLNTMHSGINGGRACWIVAGTFCNGVVQGTFARKEKDCCECPFCRKVLLEETQCMDPSEFVKLIST